MRVRSVGKTYDHELLEQDINSFWLRTLAYKQLKQSKKEGKNLYFVDGPPFTIGPIHLGIARNKVLKDATLRYKRLQGFNIRDQPGFDMHGLPIEVRVEQSLGISNKKQIEELGVERFVTTCQEYSKDFQERMTEQFNELGVWLDWENPYLTMDNAYIESVWGFIKNMYDREMLTREKGVLAWCPRCETPLTDSEIIFKETEDHSLFLKAPIKGRRDEYILVWTTLPWTLPGNLAIAVHPELNYARVNTRQVGRKETLIMLERHVEDLAKELNIEAYEIIETVKGSELEGLEYFHPLMSEIPYQKNVTGDWVHKIVAHDSVTPKHTGCVHIAPGHGIVDFEIGSEHNLPPFCPIDERGVFTTEAGMKYAGQGVKEAGNTIINDLRSMRFLLHSTTYTHRFGHCWRCESPIIYRITEQWFLRSSEAKDNIIKAIKRISWVPDREGSAKQQEWALRSKDWCISRQRYWGTPMPVWECLTDVCGHVTVIGSLEELSAGKGYKKDMNLHRPWIDNVSLECPKCGGLMRRVPDIIDVWLDSAVASWAQLGYPRKKKAFNNWWPADLNVEAMAQTHGWFYTQLCASIMEHGKVPFKSALLHGLVLDKDGRPCSRASGDDVECIELLGQHGVDALRLSLLGSAPPWEDIRLNPDNVKMSFRTLNILWNVLSFTTQYMEIDEFDPLERPFEKVRKDLQVEDTWILSKTENLIHNMGREMEAYDYQTACNLLVDYIQEDLSRWYIKIIRRRLWEEGMSASKYAAYKTLQETLTRLAVLASPIMPHITEKVHQVFGGERLTVGMESWPEVQAGRLVEGLENDMERAREIVSCTLNLRQEYGLNLRWPIMKMTIGATSEGTVDAVNSFKGVIAQQANIRTIEVVPPGEEWEGQELEVLPNPNAIGKAYKQWESKVARMLRVLPAKDVKEKIEKGEYSLGIEGQSIRILPEMVTFRTKLPENVVGVEYKEGMIYLDLTIDDDIMAEGFTREIVRRVQDMRKEMALDPEEYIKMSISMSDDLMELLEGRLEEIADSTRASDMEIVEEVTGDDYFIVEWNIEEENVVIGVQSLEVKKAMDQFLVVPGIGRELALAIVEAGVPDGEAFMEAQREFLLKIQGMSHSKLKKIRQYYETPEELRRLDEEQRCPLCNGIVDKGASTCDRCGNNLIDEEAGLDIELVGFLEDEEEEFPDFTKKEVVREEPRVAGSKEDEETVSIAEEIMEEMPRSQEAEPAETPVTKGPVMGESPEEAEPEAPEPQSAETLEEEVEPEPEEIEIPEEEVEPEPEPRRETEEPARKKDTIIEDERDRKINALAEHLDIAPSIAKLLYENDLGDLDKLKEVTEEELRKIRGVGKVSARKIIETVSSEDTQMCSLCNAIVPKDVSICPRCGVRFTPVELDTEVEEEEPRPEEKEEIVEKEELDDSDLLYSKAVTLKVAGKEEEALETVEKALEMAPEHENLLRLRAELKGETEVEAEEPEEEPDLEIGIEDLLEEREPEQAEIEMPSDEELPEREVPGKEIVEPPKVVEPASSAQEGLLVRLVREGEVSKGADDTVTLKEGFTYLIPEERSSMTYNLLKQKLDEGMFGYCVTRTYPDKVRERYELDERTPILWLSNVAKDDAVRPKDLEKLSLSLEEFLSGKGGIILLDGLEYLITNNNFITVLKLVQSIRDQVAINRSILLLSINPSTMDNHQLNLLMREVDAVLD